MARKRKPDQKKRIVQTALNLAAKSGWEKLSLAAVAKKSGVKLKDIETHFSDAWDILLQAFADIQTGAEKSVKSALGHDWRENLLEILMTRFDLAEENKAAFAQLPPALLHDPRAAKKLLKPFYRTMKRLLDVAGLPKKSCQPAVVAGFGAIYLSIAEVWLRDNTPDLSKTMSAADQRIGIFKRIFYI